MYLSYRNISVGEIGPEISGKQKSTPKPKRKFILGHPVVTLETLDFGVVVVVVSD